MRPIYATSALASSLYSMVIVVWIVSEATVLIRTIGSVGARVHMAARGQDQSSGPLLFAGVLLALWVGAGLAQLVRGAAVSSERPELFALGFLLALAGIAVRWYAIATLGRFFSMRVRTTPDQQVVVSGPYRFVRHPSYTGALMTVLGVLLMSTNWLALACFVIALPGFAYRIHVEEGALVESLGDSYRRYMHRSKRLVPFLI